MRDRTLEETRRRATLEALHAAWMAAEERGDYAAADELRYRISHACATCGAEGDDVYDVYGIYAGRYCGRHEQDAPGGRRRYWSAGDCEPMDEEE